MLVNGEDLYFNDEVNILDLISRLELSKDYIVIEVNGKIIAKEEYSMVLKDDSTVEIISFVGGG